MKFTVIFYYIYSAIVDNLVTPLQERSEDWKKSVAQLDKEHAKGKKKCNIHLVVKTCRDKNILRQKACRDKNILRQKACRDKNILRQKTCRDKNILRQKYDEIKTYRDKKNIQSNTCCDKDMPRQKHIDQKHAKIKAYKDKSIQRQKYSEKPADINMQPKTCKRIQELFCLQPISTMMEKIIKREMKYQCDGTEHKLMMKIDKITLMKYEINRKHRN